MLEKFENFAEFEKYLDLFDEINAYKDEITSFFKDQERLITLSENYIQYKDLDIIDTKKIDENLSEINESLSDIREKKLKININLLNINQTISDLAEISKLYDDKKKDAEILAVDISKKALKTAIKNAKIHGVEIDFKISDLFENVEGNFDLVVSNPPYIAQDYPLDDYVLKEPETALIGGKNGSEILINLINQSANRTKFLACEIGYDQKEILKKELVKNGFKAQFYKDLAGFDRGFTAKK